MRNTILLVGAGTSGAAAHTATAWLPKGSQPCSAGCCHLSTPQPSLGKSRVLAEGEEITMVTRKEPPRPQSHPAAEWSWNTRPLPTLEHLHPSKSKGELQRASRSPITSNITHPPCFMAFGSGGKVPASFYGSSLSEEPRED